jgi:16S rRNA (guanine527-N7)-methyltransferase
MNKQMSVSRETSEKLAQLVEMLIKWNRALNLVSKASLAQLADRHVSDSAQLAEFAPDGESHWVDIGSGGGFPGLVVAAILCETRPECHMTLVESDKRKSVFLREAARKMNLSVRVLAERAEQIPPQGADVVSARALAAMPGLCGLAMRHLRVGGRALFLKGASYQDEIQQAQMQGWMMDIAVHKSITDAQGAILEVRNLRHDAQT